MRDFNPSHLPLLPAEIDHGNWSSATGPVDLEIGSGAGLFAIKSSLEHPDRHLIAIERTEKFLRFKRRLLHHPKINNLSAIRADAIIWVSRVLPENALDQIFILYPNPYPKPKHRNLRWPNMPFMKCLLSRLKLGGNLILATNIEDYANEAEHQFTNTWNLALTEKRKLDATDNPRTHFEKKYLKRGDTCWNLIFRK